MLAPHYILHLNLHQSHRTFVVVEGVTAATAATAAAAAMAAMAAQVMVTRQSATMRLTLVGLCSATIGTRTLLVPLLWATTA